MSNVLIDPDPFVQRLLAGEEQAFVELVREYGPAMLRLARLYVSSDAVAEEVVQEAWIGMLKGLPRFEARASLRSWLFSILVNAALKRGERERRSTPFASLQRERGREVFDVGRFLGDDHARWARSWASVVRRWDGLPEEQVLSAEWRSEIRRLIDSLPPSQGAVLVLRDVEGVEPDEVSELLGISRANQRVLLHRARTRLRDALEPLADRKLGA
jgi:RNA polymerase sigma-70 factor (ECF subfamily)